MEKSSTDWSNTVRPVAVIDIGTSSIRMAIAEIHGGTVVRRLDRLSQAISLGKDTFTRGLIKRSTTEECVRVLKSYRQILEEYQISRSDQIRVVATSAVREAQNRQAFADRIFSATGLDVTPIDEAEVNRVTYLGMRQRLLAHPLLSRVSTVITEVGGGSTDLLVVEQGNVVYSHTFRLGSIRLRETLEAYDAPTVRVRTLMENQIERTVEEIRQHIPSTSAIEMVTLGGDARFAAAQLVDNWSPEGLSSVPISALARLADEMLVTPEDELIHKYRLTFADAETRGPALLAYVRLAQMLQLDHVYVTDFNLRDALLNEMAVPGFWSDEFASQVFQSGVELGRRYNFGEAHGRHVAFLAEHLFRELQAEHQLSAQHGNLLSLAALLHEIGIYVNSRGHHKHTMYLISNSELFGLGKSEMHLVALVARYHRRAVPKPTHEIYMNLDRESRIAVAKLAAILRVADCLDASRSQRVRDVRCTREKSRFVVSVRDVEDLSLEQISLRQKGGLFQDVYGVPVLLRREKV